MITFDNFSAYDVEKDLMRFRCYVGEQFILCGVTRAALVAGAPHGASSLAELKKLYELRTEVIRRAVLNRLERRGRSEHGPVLVDVGDM
ncbi:MAG TPA: hypothetical protein VM659_00285 [Dongiaceae bacterium]|nr:hypothetical protein [Dongiaceae bacterium]